MAARAIPTLLLHSQSQDPEQAMREWTCDPRKFSVLDEDEAGKCQLCGQTGLSEMFRISNSLTGSTLLVGFDCAARWTRHGDATTEDDNRRILERRIEEEKARAEQGLALAVLTRLVPELLSGKPAFGNQVKFCRLSTAFLGAKLEFLSDPKRVAILLAESLGRPATAVEGQVLRTYLYNAAPTVVRESAGRATRRDDSHIGRWANITRSRSTPAKTSHARSETYHNPAEIVADRVPSKVIGGS